MRAKAFTLIELLVVIAVVAILIALIFPTISGAKEKAKNVACVYNLRSLLAATLQEATSNNGVLPVLHQPTYNNPYWFGADALESFRIGNELPKDAFYSPSNPKWNADSYWDYTANARVGGYIYLANDNNWAASTSVNGTGVTDTPLFARRLVDQPAYKQIWVDLTRQLNGQWGSGVNHQHRKSGEPTGSHSGFMDGHVEWVPWDEISDRYFLIGGTTMWF